MMNSFLSYCKGSFFIIAFEFNPFRWRTEFSWITESDYNPGFIVECRMIGGPVMIHFRIDDMRW